MPKKVILMLVEGETEEAALYEYLEQLPQNAHLHFHVVQTDIFSRRDVLPDNVEAKVTKLINKSLGTRSFLKSDILFIAQITDTDGCYLPSEKIVYDADVKRESGTNHIYVEDGILTTKSEEHNEMFRDSRLHKRKNMDVLTTATKIHSDIPYRLYYMSVNLEHALNNRHIYTRDKKMESSDEFAERFDDIHDFVRFFNHKMLNPQANHEETWRLLHESNNQLASASNLFLLLEKLSEM